MKLITDDKLRQKIIKKDAGLYGFDIFQIVTCFHCGKTFPICQLQVYETDKPNEYFLACKYREDGCSGNLMDLIEIDE